jgi:hypothetical protein
MSSLIPGSCFMQEAMHICFGVIFVVLAFAAHTAQSKEGLFAPKTDLLTIKLVNTDIKWQPSYRLNTNVALNPSEDSIPSRLGFSFTPRMFLIAEPKKEADWSINIRKQIPSGSDCSTLSSLICFDSKEERPEIKPQRDSFWVVWRKALPF